MVCVFVTVFLASLGACIGSFLNVVVYRLPRGLSLSQPRRSFCPACRRQIAWYDNIPIVSWIALRGRCRHCRQPISLQYPVVETAAVIVTLVLWHWALGAYAATPPDAWWPVLAGVLALFWCLLALSAMDLEEYYVDIRLTWLALAIGVVAHALAPPEAWPTGPVSPAGAAFAAGCTVALVVMHWLWPMPGEELAEGPVDGAGTEPPAAVQKTQPQEPALPESGVTSPPAEGPLTSEPPVPPSTQILPVEAEQDGRIRDAGSPVGPPADGQLLPVDEPGPGSSSYRLAFPLLLAIIAVVMLMVQVMACRAATGTQVVRAVVGAGLFGLFASILAGSWIDTEADEQIAEAVEAERPMAMRHAVREAVLLAVAVGAGLGAWWLVRQSAVAEAWTGLLAWGQADGWQPVAGMATALFGWVVAGGACWFMRVFFTLLLRKEALGFGDIHIIGAAGAVIGPHLAIAGFFLAAPVALLGTGILLFRKRYRTLPFGPWLGMGFLLAVLWSEVLAGQIRDGLEGVRQMLVEAVRQMAGG